MIRTAFPILAMAMCSSLECSALTPVPRTAAFILWALKMEASVPPVITLAFGARPTAAIASLARTTAEESSGILEALYSSLISISAFAPVFVAASSKARLITSA